MHFIDLLPEESLALVALSRAIAPGGEYGSAAVGDRLVFIGV
jgi:hypothetical protein